MKVGIIGCGKIAQVRHIPEYFGNQFVEIGGYYDFNNTRAEEMADRFGGTAYLSIEDMLNDETIEAVSVCVANNAHAEISIQALMKGKDVLCEKPMATSLEDCVKMVEAAQKNKRKLMIGQNQRFTPAHQKARKLLKEGVIGKVLTFQTSFSHKGPETWCIDGGSKTWFFDKRRAAMGAMADLGVHKTDLIQFLLGEKIVEVSAVLRTLDKKDSEGRFIQVDDNAVCTYTMESGAVGTMSASWTNYGQEENSTIIYGTEGVMKIYANPCYSLEIIAANGERILYDIDQIQTNDNQTSSGVIDAFVGAVVEGKELMASGEEVLHAMRVVFAGIESNKLGKRIMIDREMNR